VTASNLEGTIEERIDQTICESEIWQFLKTAGEEKRNRNDFVWKNASVELARRKRKTRVHRQMYVESKRGADRIYLEEELTSEKRSSNQHLDMNSQWTKKKSKETRQWWRSPRNRNNVELEKSQSSEKRKVGFWSTGP